MTNEQLAQRVDDLDEKVSMLMRHFGLDPVLVVSKEDDREQRRRQQERVESSPPLRVRDTWTAEDNKRVDDHLASLANQGCY